MTRSTRPPVSNEFDVLVFAKTAGYRHASIPDGIAGVERLGAEHHFGVTATSDADAFARNHLERYAVVIWLSTSGTVLGAEQRAAFENYIRGGGGYVGVHAAADTEYEWSWYGGLVGAYFYDHPSIQRATVEVAGSGSPATAGLPAFWTRTDEWYNYRSQPRENVRVLARVNESTYDPVGSRGGRMGADHPIAWCQMYDGGRSFYTGMGHTADSYREPLFLQHLLGGIQMVAGTARLDCR